MELTFQTPRVLIRGRGKVKQVVMAAAIIAGLLMLGLPQGALAETGQQRFHVTYSGPFDPVGCSPQSSWRDCPTRRVTAAGPIKGKGYEQFISEGPGTEPGTYQAVTQFVFPEGTVFLTITGTIEEVEHRFNPNACQGFNRVMNAEWVITGGTGAYEGATGQGTFKGHNILYGEKTPDGCPPLPDRLVSNLRGVGTATVPGDQAA